MRNRLSIAVPVTAVAILVLVVASAFAGGRPLSADLLGSNEVPPVSTGDPDGSGTANLTLNQGRGEICLEIEVQNISAPILQHIHRGAAGVNGPVVVDFTPLLAGGGDGCVGGVDRSLVKEIRKNPEGFYFNVHTGDFPGGAVRGQLGK
jgi:hypothetical protein